VSDRDLGIAGATQQLVAQVGTTVGMNGLEAVQVATVDSAGLGGSYRNAYLLGAVMAILGVGTAMFLVDPGERRGPRRR
jgi:hypothetical protein